ncbi:hypothetical protein TELCIR_00585 [Teladorsagia circumcincta]|uniref:Uncharacterized protein n=1 Tax=Teladorsagia circumcincta TaxID=45464 RepID=A0A2G9V475_TELCI|nr:hypothetical protein TELCIR_00585 [Teladorsagia circumcincta]
MLKETKRIGSEEDQVFRCRRLNKRSRAPRRSDLMILLRCWVLLLLFVSSTSFPLDDQPSPNAVLPEDEIFRKARRAPPKEKVLLLKPQWAWPFSSQTHGSSKNLVTIVKNIRGGRNALRWRKIAEQDERDRPLQQDQKRQQPKQPIIDEHHS